ncbi:hypothetical protein HYS93_04200 [Candidatus Daviesbacteria bacterium]|nr:hypothetical protein [Candidatus Daviesbacteria bacterium]
MLPKLFAISVITTVFLIGFSVFYYFVIFTPKVQEQKVQKEKQVSLNNCLQEAEVKYRQFWSSECQSLNLKDNCRLSEAITDRIDKKLSDLKEDCFKQFPPSAKK